MKTTIETPIRVREIARNTGLHNSQVSRIFNGHCVPNLQTAVLIARHLNVTVDSLAKFLNIS